MSQEKLNNKTSIRKEDILVIGTGKGITYSMCKSEGIDYLEPYVGYRIIKRIIANLCFKYKFFQRSLFYNKAKPKKYVMIRDPLITNHYLRWIIKKMPKSKIVFFYCNLVGKAKHIKPNEIPNGIDLWTYDGNDASTYNMKLSSSISFSRNLVKELKKPEYDIYYFGKDKGRAEKILFFKSEFEKMGLKTFFSITKDGFFSHNKRYYSKPISYDDNLDYLTRTKSVLNIVSESQTGLTTRDAEAIFFGVKLITNNKAVRKAGFYSPSRVFILGEDNLASLPLFLNEPFEMVPEHLLKEYDYFFQLINRFKE